MWDSILYGSDVTFQSFYVSGLGKKILLGFLCGTVKEGFNPSMSVD